MKNCKQADESYCNKVCCCKYCEEMESCVSVCTDIEQADTCDRAIDVDTIIPLDKAEPQLIQKISSFWKQKKQLEEAEAQLKEQLQKAMELNGIKSFKNDLLSITYVDAYKKKTFDKKAFNKKHPDIDLSEFDKLSDVKASVRIKLNDKGDK